MSNYRKCLPWNKAALFLCYVGLETDLIFNQGFDLPGFASYPLLETEHGRAALEKSYRDQIALAEKHNVGLQLDSATWMANKDRAAILGYSPADLVEINIQALKFLASARERYGDCPTVISANVGTRSDAYAPTEIMSVDEAESYHMDQIAVLARTEADIITAMTLSYAEEAIGIVRAAKRYHMPVVISFTVAIDGTLPTGEALGVAIQRVDAATEGYAEHFMINCAHPDHFTAVLTDAPWIGRLKGIVANASRCSHAELDEAEELDDGNPVELGGQLAEIRNRFPQVFMLGGCCGTDLRHMAEIAQTA